MCLYPGVSVCLSVFACLLFLSSTNHSSLMTCSSSVSVCVSWCVCVCLYLLVCYFCLCVCLFVFWCLYVFVRLPVFACLASLSRANHGCLMMCLLWLCVCVSEYVRVHPCVCLFEFHHRFGVQVYRHNT